MKRPPLTAKRLRELLSYNQRTGVFRWRETRGPVNAGDIAGTPTAKNYIRIFVDYRAHLAQRLVWLWMKGKPGDTLAIVPASVDHENTIRNDNRWRNLRASTQSQNLHNSKVTARNVSGFKWVRTRRYQSGAIRYQADVGGYVLGCFSTPEAAHAAAKTYARRAHGAFFNPGGSSCQSTSKAKKTARPPPRRQQPASGSRTASI